MKRVSTIAAIALALVIFALGYATGVRRDLTPARAIAADDCQSFSQTNHQVCGVFLQYWQNNGGLAQQGYPISDPFMEQSATDGKMYQVQYFERAVFELHPELQAPNNVLLSLLGSEKYKAKYAAPTATATSVPTTAPAATPTTTPDAKATTLAIAGIVATPTATDTAAGTLPVSITNITSPVARGAGVTLTAKTVPGAVCGIEVEYASGASKPQGLGDKTAAANGVTGWTWTVATRTTPNNWAVTVTCHASGMTGTIQTTLQVT